MRFRASILPFVATALLGPALEAFAADPPAAPAPPAEKTIVPIEKPAAAVADAAPASGQSELRLEEIRSLRDPFSQPPQLIRLTEEPRSELEKFPTQSFKLIGVLTGLNKYRAMLLAPDNRTYVVSEKTRIGQQRGVIVKISTDRIHVRETTIDGLGGKISSDMELLLRPEEMKAKVLDTRMDSGNSPMLPPSQQPQFMGMPQNSISPQQGQSGFIQGQAVPGMQQGMQQGVPMQPGFQQAPMGIPGSVSPNADPQRRSL